MKNWRIVLVLIIFFAFGAGLMGRLFYLQVKNYKFYLAQALGQQVGFVEAKGSRGQIYFQDGQPVAINKSVWALIDNKNGYKLIKKGLTEEEIEQFKKTKPENISLESSVARFYPQGSLAAQVIGFVNGDGVGQYGIEGFYDDILKGKVGIREQKRGLDLVGQEDKNNFDGSDVYLTIDYNIQFQAESLLKEAKKNVDFDSAQIIVLKPDSGKILAIANYPSFNLNQYSAEKDMEIFQNSVLQKIFEPGSVLKPFTMASAINEGKITPQTTYTDSGMLKIGPETIYNFDRKKYGLQTMAGVLEKSINTGAVFAQKTLDSKTYLDYLDRFGFFQKTGIDLQGEVFSENNILRQGREINLATSSFGQGIEMSPIRLAASFCSFANGGKMVKPYIIDRIVSDKEEKKSNPVVTSQVFSKQTASQVSVMLEGVIENGFGKLGKVPGYYLAGKTGTAQVPIPGGVGYYPSDKTIQTFIGFGPVSYPQFLIMVKLDNPRTSASSLSSAPIFKELANYILNYWQIPPDYDINK